MPQIISLEGDLRSGKSTTLDLLYDLMKAKGYTAVLDRRKSQSRDLTVILQKEGINIGLSSYGNNAALIGRHVDSFIEKGCSIIICACRTYGLTKNILENYSDCTKTFIAKTTATFKSNRQKVNLLDAKKILKEIEEKLEH